jgi:hypothetical protein
MAKRKPTPFLALLDAAGRNPLTTEWGAGIASATSASGGFGTVF